MSGIMIGNLGVEDIERQLGIEFEDEDFQLLKETHQEQVSSREGNVKYPERSWHFFDIPRQLIFGSYKFFVEFKGILKKYDLKGNIQVAYHLSDDEKIENNYTFRTEEDYPRYLYGFRVGNILTEFDFFQLRKVNKKTLVYSRVSTLRFHKDILGLEEWIRHDLLVPKKMEKVEDNWDDFKISKDLLLYPMNDEVSFVSKAGYFEEIQMLNIWNGEEISEKLMFKKIDYSDAEQCFKDYRKHKNKVLKGKANG